MKAADGTLRGFNVLVGGGLGRTHNKQRRSCGSPAPERLWSLSRSWTSPERSWSPARLWRPRNRRHDAVKYTIADRGLVVSRRGPEPLDVQLRPPERCPGAVDDHLGWHEQGDGTLYVGIYMRTAVSPTSMASALGQDCGQDRRRAAPRSASPRRERDPRRHQTGRPRAVRRADGQTRDRRVESIPRRSGTRWPPRDTDVWAGRR